MQVRDQGKQLGEPLRDALVADEEFGFRLQSNLDLEVTTYDFKFRQTTDDHGFPNAADWPDTADIVVLGDTLVIRVRRAPDPEQLEHLNGEYADLLAGGKIAVSKALPEEAGEVDHYPRVLLQFNRHAMGRLRTLIDTLNSYVTEAAAPPLEAAPHEIVEGRMTPEAESAEDDE